jgi:OOP family OmpA-OmpF porin
MKTLFLALVLATLCLFQSIPGQAQTTDQNSNASFKTYQNYDFIPGDKVLFEDHFENEQDGEFPSRWQLKNGQAVMNKIEGQPAFFLIEGSYAQVAPRMKTENYLTDPFTVEFDYYPVQGAYALQTMFYYMDKAEGYQKEAHLSLDRAGAIFNGEGVDFKKSLPEDIGEENFMNKWHHVAMAYKNHQLKIYVDQYRVLVVPDTKHDYERIELAGYAEEKLPQIIKNVRIASGGNMNMIGKKFTESKIVTHGINFDFNKATIRPESMGTLNMVATILKENPEIKFEIGGYTDADGDDQYNLKLSEQRANTVLAQLVSMGVDQSRLTAKGYGEAKPISDNSTPEGKANNRRVEFVKK